MSELLAKAQWLLSIPSPTTQEAELCQQLQSWMQAKVPQARCLQFRQGLRVTPPVKPHQPWVALVGHLDTVPPAQQQRQGIEGGRLYGCGASDMKAGVAVMLHLLEHWQQFPCNLLGLFYDREEGPYADNGLEGLLDLEPLPTLEYAVVLEPTSNQIQAGCVGSLQARLTFEGQRAHSARPWQGDNAIYKALPLLNQLSQQPRRSVLCQGLEFFEVVSVTQAHSPGPRNAVPETFCLNLNARFAPGKSPEEALREIEALVGQQARLEVDDIAPSGQVKLDHPSLQGWIARQGLRVEPKQAWTDVARLSQRGLAAFNFGPGDPAQAHQADEFVECALVESNAALLSDLLRGTSHLS